MVFLIYPYLFIILKATTARRLNRALSLSSLKAVLPIILLFWNKASYSTL
jgi:hypothetical protein